MRDYIEERAIHIAQYIVDNGHGSPDSQTVWCQQINSSQGCHTAFDTNKSAPGFPDTDYSRYQ